MYSIIPLKTGSIPNDTEDNENNATMVKAEPLPWEELKTFVLISNSLKGPWTFGRNL